VALVTSAPKLAKDEAWLDWHARAVELERQVRAFDPWPVAQTRLEEQVIRVFAATAEQSAQDVAPGSVLEAGRDGVLVATGAGALRLQTVQRQGARRISAADFANQRPLAGCQFG
jgi:methionyl-tRNA formyltransferase